MKNTLNDYIKYVDKSIKDKKGLKELKEEHLIKIGFFQHERLIHLLVTLFFAVFLILFLILIQYNSYAFLAVVVVLIVLVFYIIHYYRLENGVQYLYKQYDEICNEINKKKK